MEAFQNFQHLLTHIFDSSSSPEAVVESNQPINEGLDRENPQQHIPTQQQETENPSTAEAVDGSNTSNDNVQDSGSPRRRLSCQQQVARSSRVNETPSPPLRRSPRLTDHASNSSNKENVDSSGRPTGEVPSRESPRAPTNSQQEIVKSFKVSKPALPPLRRSPRNTDPRSTRHGSIPNRCCEYVDEARQQRCGNFDGFEGIEVNACETEGSVHHRGFGESYNVCEPCRTRVSPAKKISSHTDSREVV